MPSGAPSPMTPSRNVPSSFERDVFDRAVEPGHAARDRAAFERRAGRARRGEDAMPVADDQLGVRADVHDRDEPLFVREIDRQHACGGVGADVAADDRQRRRRARWDESAAGCGGRSSSGWSWSRLPSAISISVIERYGFWPIEYTLCRKNRSRIVELPTTTIS